MNSIRRVAVLGAGAMGSRIAAHFANAGVPSVLLDIVLPGEADRDAAAKKGLQAAATQRPGAFFTDSAPQLISAGNFEDDLERVAECDWVIEAVVENLEVKRELWSRVVPFVRPNALLSTNTSGIPLAQLSEALDPDARKRFFGAHFFNPPRYLRLVELIPGPATDEEPMRAAERFCDRRLGKGVVRCKDTPNFIANRIGAFFGATVHKILADGDYTIEEADALTGPLIGLPKSASFRLLDIIGLDVWKAVIENVQGAEAGPWRERFQLPGFLSELIERGWLGEKAGLGFYRRMNRGGAQVIEAIDWKSFEYHEAAKPTFPSVETAAGIADLGERLRFLIHSGDRAGEFLWKLFSDLFLYSAGRVPEISGRIVEIDRAMRWGYAFELGPFELWDAAGFEETARRMEREGRELPDSIQFMLESGVKSFYRSADADGAPRTEYFDLEGGEHRPVEDRPGIVKLADVKRARGVVGENAGASLLDLGDGVLCAEFHTKMNALGEDAFRMVRQALEETARNYTALVIANQGAHFSAGADLAMLLLAAQEGGFDRIDAYLKSFQEMNMAIRCADRPVVAAPFGYTLGGGCEAALHAARIQASAELYMGLVEGNVGLIPAGGGTKQMVLNFGDPGRVFELISRAKTSGSAAQAREMGLLTEADGITMNSERLIGDAKQLALSLAPDYVPKEPRTDVAVGGEAAYAKLKMGTWQAHEAGRVTDYGLVIAEKLIHVICGGRLTGKQTVSEQYLLDLEREAFLSLCGAKRTQEMIGHMLRTGKPLRN